MQTDRTVKIHCRVKVEGFGGKIVEFIGHYDREYSDGKDKEGSAAEFL